MSDLRTGDKVYAAIFKAIVGFCVIVGFGAWQAYVVQKIWLWYMVDKFGARMVPLSMCYITVVVVRVITDNDCAKTPTPPGKKPFEGFWSGLAAKFLLWGILMLIAKVLR